MILPIGGASEMEGLQLMGLPHLVNRPSVARGVLQSPPLLINQLSCSSFCSKSSRHCLSQTVRASELKGSADFAELCANTDANHTFTQFS